MNPTEYVTMYAVEDRHWWYVGMQRLTLALLRQVYPTQTNLAILDAGCGTGAAASYLSALGQVTGLDYVFLALGFCQRRGLKRLSQGTVTQLPFASASAEFFRTLKPGGRLLLRLPAYNALRSHHDQIIHTQRRFSAPEIRQALSNVGFVNEKISYANTVLFPAAAGKRLLERVWPVQGEQSDVKPNPPWQDKFLAHILGLEARWLTHFNLPFGLTVVSLSRKPITNTPITR
jgi:SAM-dependent methyltransferase